jgi:DNA-binding Lrp family transcriptional regulator
MTTENQSQNPDEVTALTLIQQIKDGLLNPKLLSKEQRIQCVDILYFELPNEASIAQFLKVSTKTISRDIAEIQERNAMIPNVDFAKKFIGDVFRRAMNHHSALVRIARARETNPAEKILAETAAWRILKELVEKFQTTGHLPSLPQTIVGDFYHHLDADKEETLDDMVKKLDAIEAASKEDGSYDTEVGDHIKFIKMDIEKAKIANSIENLNKKQEKQGESDEAKQDQ